MERIGETSPRLEARITGAFYLLTLLTGIFAQGFVSGSLVVYGDAAATGTNILMHKSLFQLGFAVYLIEMACQIAITALFYDLLKPTGRSVSLVAAFLGLTGCIIKTLSRLFFIAPLFILGGFMGRLMLLATCTEIPDWQATQGVGLFLLAFFI